ncbi:DNA topoisomerase III (plasmid) [Clostridium botulinum Af84]|uniref:DNA topoisomerase III n=1 Tax=Clostridium botulinum TaxID=1491 RepID=UPI00035BA767|nr:DNA topoisomerase III [Clostridium botulinum]APR02732.1 putative dNA topoisomerase III [Clostridium botulinum]AUN19855.1 DNA topoisomerase III [Clostridium botulinum]EPS54468.1 DNA topoisomerase III [Clostridium botulinum Af84]NFM82799.1 DNA topoisomerase III [Clostridium botulinum]NFP10079.1 DNA topoisomerase III [Clostridium botulinum]
MTKLIIGVVLLIIANILIEEIKENIKRKEENIKKNIICRCPFCGQYIIKEKNNYTCSNNKNGCLFNIKKSICNTEITELDILKLIAEGKSRIFTSKSQSDNLVNFQLQLDSNKEIIKFKYCNSSSEITSELYEETIITVI